MAHAAFRVVSIGTGTAHMLNYALHPRSFQGGMHTREWARVWAAISVIWMLSTHL